VPHLAVRLASEYVGQRGVRREGVDGHRFAVKDDGRVQHISEDVGVVGVGVLGGGGQQQRARSRRQTRALRSECFSRRAVSGRGRVAGNRPEMT
jgi:hypothetical protein